MTRYLDFVLSEDFTREVRAALRLQDGFVDRPLIADLPPADAFVDVTTYTAWLMKQFKAKAEEVTTKAVSDALLFGALQNPTAFKGLLGDHTQHKLSVDGFVTKWLTSDSPVFEFPKSSAPKSDIDVANSALGNAKEWKVYDFSKLKSIDGFKFGSSIDPLT